MATRGARKIRGAQITGTELRDSHFSVDNKVNEDKIDIDWLSHRETLEATKIDVRVQVNNKVVGGQNSLVITTDMVGRSVSSGAGVEGVVLTEKVLIRKAGTDSPLPDPDADPVYGKITEDAGVWTLSFYSMEGGTPTETAYTMPADVSIDFSYVLRTNLGVIPVDAIIKGGAGFVEGATDATAYMNLEQLKKDLYGAAGTLDKDGNANLTDTGYGASVYERITNFIAALASTEAGKGADLLGVIVDGNYTGTTVQEVLSDLASRLSGAETDISDIQDELSDAVIRAASANAVFGAQTFTQVGDRLDSLETIVDSELKGLKDRVTDIENSYGELIVEADGTGTQLVFALPDPAIPATVVVYLNGVAQAPVLNYDRTLTNGAVTSITLPQALTIPTDPEADPDSLYVTYTKA